MLTNGFDDIKFYCFKKVLFFLTLTYLSFWSTCYLFPLMKGHISFYWCGTKAQLKASDVFVNGLWFQWLGKCFLATLIIFFWFFCSFLVNSG